MIKLKNIIETENLYPFAAFILVKVNGGYAATTRAKDRGEEGKVGLPGGKIDKGENPIEAAIRESKEEGWEIKGVYPEIFHQQLVDGKLVWWFRAQSANMLSNFKEKGRIIPIIITREQLLNSGYGNENLKI